jgi:DNA polymerase-3 subunit epsilon
MYFLHKRILRGIIEKWLGSDDVIIDTETTGLKEDDEIIEIAIINMSGEVLLNTLVKPTRNIPADVINIHHITNEMVASAPSWAEIYPQVMEIIDHRKWLAWNSKFDARLITQTSLITGQYDGLSAAEVIHEYNRIHHNQIDAKRTYSEWYGEFEEDRQGFKRQHLAAAIAQQNVDVDGAAHRALADCLMVLDVLKAVAERGGGTLNVTPNGYFAYDTDGGFTNHDTAKRAQKEAQDAIECFRESACDGWSDEVDSVCWGVIIQQAEKVDERPVTSEDKCASHIDCYCDYALLPAIKTEGE